MLQLEWRSTASDFVLHDCDHILIDFISEVMVVVYSLSLFWCMHYARRSGIISRVAMSLKSGSGELGYRRCMYKSNSLIA